jgi:hypothetical protein
LELVDVNQPQTTLRSAWSRSLYFSVLCLGAHVAMRFLAPHADPVPLPVLGPAQRDRPTMIHRIDLAYAFAAQQNGNPLPSEAAPADIEPRSP